MPSAFNELEILQALVRNLLSDLPTKRDWLDPLLEKELRARVFTELPMSLSPRTKEMR